MGAQRTLRLDPNDPSSFPKRSELPEIPGAMPGAAWFWGEDDEVRTAFILRWLHC